MVRSRKRMSTLRNQIIERDSQFVSNAGFEIHFVNPAVFTRRYEPSDNPEPPMANSYVAICDSFESSSANVQLEQANCTGLLLNRVHRSVRTPGRGLSFEVLYRDRQRVGPEGEIILEFRVAEEDLNKIIVTGTPTLIAACKTWIENHSDDTLDARPRVLPLAYFQDSPTDGMAGYSGSVSPPSAVMRTG
jgi:hypothetical protein